MLKTIEKGCEPQLATKYSTAIDLFASEDVVIGAGETKVVGLGVCIDLEHKRYYIQNYLEKENSIYNKADEKYFFDFFKRTHYLELYPRRSLRTKGLISSAEIIPLDFKDEIKIIIHNSIKSGEILNYIRLAQGFDESSQIYTEFEIKKGDKIAQILLKEHKTYLMGITNKYKKN